MAFRDFTFPEVLADFGLTETAPADLFAAVPPIPAGPIARHAAGPGARLALMVNSEKGRSEWIVAPILCEAWEKYGHRVGLYSGLDFQADPAADLNGFCDFLLGHAPQSFRIRAPLAVVFEAKKDSIPDGLGQCIAAMVGILRFKQREGNPTATSYGCVTTGSLWRFLWLAGTYLTLDVVEYTLPDVDKLLGILCHLYGPIPLPAAA
jgi:hypothetical protein